METKRGSEDSKEGGAIRPACECVFCRTCVMQLYNPGTKETPTKI